MQRSGKTEAVGVNEFAVVGVRCVCENRGNMVKLGEGEWCGYMLEWDIAPARQEKGTTSLPHHQPC